MYIMASLIEIQSWLFPFGIYSKKMVDAESEKDVNVELNFQLNYLYRRLIYYVAATSETRYIWYVCTNEQLFFLCLLTDRSYTNYTLITRANNNSWRPRL